MEYAFEILFSKLALRKSSDLLIVEPIKIEIAGCFPPLSI